MDAVRVAVTSGGTASAVSFIKALRNQPEIPVEILAPTQLHRSGNRFRRISSAERRRLVLQEVATSRHQDSARQSAPLFPGKGVPSSTNFADRDGKLLAIRSGLARSSRCDCSIYPLQIAGAGHPLKQSFSTGIAAQALGDRSLVPKGSIGVGGCGGPGPRRRQSASCRANIWGASIRMVYRRHRDRSKGWKKVGAPTGGFRFRNSRGDYTR